MAGSKPFYKKWWFWVIIVILVLGLFGAIGGGGSKQEGGNTPSSGTVEPSSDSQSQDPQGATQPSVTATGIRTEVQEAMDSYTAFVDEYCTFIKDYSKAGKPASMLADYLALVARSNEMERKMAEIEDWDLSPEEEKLYTDTMLKCSIKLQEVALML